MKLWVFWSLATGKIKLNILRVQKEITLIRLPLSLLFGVLFLLKNTFNLFRKSHLITTKRIFRKKRMVCFTIKINFFINLFIIFSVQIFDKKLKWFLFLIFNFYSFKTLIKKAKFVLMEWNNLMTLIFDWTHLWSWFF